MSTEQTPAAEPATLPLPDPPVGAEIGLREARSQLGELTDKARYLDQVTYLTRHGSRVAAVVPAEAARTREQLHHLHEHAAVEQARLHADYERLTRAADASLDATEVLWVRAYLRVLQALEKLTWTFHAAVDEALERALADERRPHPDDSDDDSDDDDDDDFDDDAQEDDGLAEVKHLLQAESARREFADRIQGRVEELMRADARHPGRGPALDWTAWAVRIEKLATAVAAADPADGDFVVRGARRRLAAALAEVATMLAEAESAPPAEVPEDVTGYGAEHIWAQACALGNRPLLTSFHALGEGMRLPAESARRAVIELHRSGRVQLYRYFRGHQSEADPAHLHDRAGFHLVLTEPLSEQDPVRPTIIMDM